MSLIERIVQIQECLLEAMDGSGKDRVAFEKIRKVADEHLAEHERLAAMVVRLTPMAREISSAIAAQEQITRTGAKKTTAATCADAADAPASGRPHFETWDEYEDNGVQIPEARPATPTELRAIMDEFPMPKTPKKTKEWQVKTIRNLAASRLMAERMPETQFMVKDFAELMQAAGLHDSTVDAVRKTLMEHLTKSPEFRETGLKGQMQLVNHQQSEDAVDSTSTEPENVAPDQAPVST